MKFRHIYSMCLLAVIALVSTSTALAAAPGTKHPVLGIYYFDGWADPTSANFHMHGLTGQFAAREPLSGWYDNSARLVHQQIVWAHRALLNFFVFDWYDTSSDANSSDKTLNSALGYFIKDEHKLGMKYALLYVNNGSFSIAPSKWKAQCRAWVHDFFVDRNYQTIDGMPLIVVFSAEDMDKTWSTPQGVAGAWSTLQSEAKKAGLPGVFVACCALPGPQYGWSDISRLAKEGYSGFTGYNYPGMSGTLKGENAYAIIQQGSISIFNDFTKGSTLPYIPVVMTGWDPRPWKETDFWYKRSPQQLAQLVTSTLDWWLASPGVRPVANTPVILLEAWNELGEGSFIVPTKGDGYSYSTALRSAVTRWDRSHNVR